MVEIDVDFFLISEIQRLEEVDFLYFIMFTLSKIGFGISETHFFVYGETTENETFITELRKFVKNLKIFGFCFSSGIRKHHHGEPSPAFPFPILQRWHE
jgi:hypothetical protein